MGGLTHRDGELTVFLGRLHESWKHLTWSRQMDRPLNPSYREKVSYPPPVISIFTSGR